VTYLESLLSATHAWIAHTLILATEVEDEEYGEEQFGELMNK
jgi:hypothetical protein